MILLNGLDGSFESILFRFRPVCDAPLLRLSYGRSSYGLKKRAHLSHGTANDSYGSYV
jgi:hypothetical protein